MGNHLGLGAKSVCGFFTRESNVISKMVSKNANVLIIHLKQ